MSADLTFDRTLLVPLTGTVKQVEWAERIRLRKLDELEAYYADLLRQAQRAKQPPPRAEDVAKAKAAIVAKLNRRTAASWWIEHRDLMAHTIRDMA